MNLIKSVVIRFTNNCSKDYELDRSIGRYLRLTAHWQKVKSYCKFNMFVFIISRTYKRTFVRNRKWKRSRYWF